MTDKEFSIVLRELACSQKTPLCKEWTEQWDDDSDIDVLLDKYVRGFDFCVKNDYPSLEFSRKYFTDKKESLHRHHIYFDEDVDIETHASGFWIFLGSSKGRVRFNGFAVATVYLRHDSDLVIESTGLAKVFVKKYDKSRCSTGGDGFIKVRE